MKNFLLFIFFLLFISVLFMWDHELTSFWLDPENRSFLIREILTWGEKYSFVLDYLQAYKYEILALGVLYFSYVGYSKWQKKRKERAKNNIFHGGKVIYDANAILSPDSLPEADKKREKKLRDAPPLINSIEGTEEIIPPPAQNDDDLDAETMRRMLNSR